MLYLVIILSPHGCYNDKKKDNAFNNLETNIPPDYHITTHSKYRRVKIFRLFLLKTQVIPTEYVE